MPPVSIARAVGVWGGMGFYEFDILASSEKFPPAYHWIAASSQSNQSRKLPSASKQSNQ